MLAATYACVKYCSPWITPITTEKRITGVIDGRVTQRRLRRGPAPSRAADSYRCFGTSSTAARKMIIVAPTPQSPSRTSEGFDQLGELNQSGPLIPRCLSPMLTGPVAGFRRYTKPSAAATGGANAGRYNTAAKKPAPSFARASITAIPNAKSTFNGTDTPT